MRIMVRNGEAGQIRICAEAVAFLAMLIIANLLHADPVLIGNVALAAFQLGPAIQGSDVIGEMPRMIELDLRGVLGAGMLVKESGMTFRKSADDLRFLAGGRGGKPLDDISGAGVLTVRGGPGAVVLRALERLLHLRRVPMAAHAAF